MVVRYGRFDGPLSRAEPEKIVLLDDADKALANLPGVEVMRQLLARLMADEDLQWPVIQELR